MTTRPRPRPAPAARTDTVCHHPARQDAAPGRRTLLVVAEGAARHTLVRALEARCHELVVCDSAPAAWEACSREEFPLIITGDLPEATGAELCRGIRALPRGGRSLVLVIPTQMGDPRTLAVVLDAGADDYLDLSLDAALLELRLSAAERMVARLEEGEQTEAALRRAEERLAHQSSYDPLTGLPNRTLFMNRLEQALLSASRQRDAVAVLFLDLDGFKVINDTLGYASGDELLAGVAGRLAASVRAGDTIARFGGDEFTVLLEGITHQDDAIRVAERITEELRMPLALGGREVFVTASIGIAVNGTGQERPDDLLQHADVALHRAKGAGRSRRIVFSPEMNTNTIERLDLETDLRRAVERGELRVHYQPELDLAAGRIVGMEALARWQHPLRGLISPAEFIPMAEETGLILPIGWWVLEQACRQARRWQAQHPHGPTLVMSVNLSARQFQHPDLVGQVARVLRRTRLEPAYLRLEITETVVMDGAESIIETLRRLKALGVQLAIDDFGTGYSSLAYLKRFPVDVLKVDKSFVDGLGQDPEDTAIVRAVITLAKSLGLRVTGEGVETSEQMTQLRAMGCDLAQGYYFARPLTSEAAATWLSGEQGLKSA
jgi:diguanylate cyclase (GGDEF)-like protein